MPVGEVATAASRHENLLASFVRTFENDDTPATASCHACTHEAGGAAAQNNDIVIIHCANIAAEIAAP